MAQKIKYSLLRLPPDNRILLRSFDRFEMKASDEDDEARWLGEAEEPGHEPCFRYYIYVSEKRGVSIVQEKPVELVTGQSFPRLLEGSLGRRMSVMLKWSTCLDLMSRATETYRIRNRAVTATKKSQATIALTWLRRKVDHR